MEDRPKTGGRKLRQSTYDRTEAPPTPKKRKTATPTKKDQESLATIQSLPPELLEEILSWVSVRDVISFGATCSSFHQLSLSPSLWRKQCHHQATRTLPASTPSTNWKRTAILKYSQALYLQRLGSSSSGREGFPWSRVGGQPQVTQAMTPPLALGFRRCLPTRDHLLLWDHQGTVFVLRNAVTSSPRSQLTWRRVCRHSVLCHQAKDFAVDPRSDVSFRQYVYVLLRRPSGGVGGAPPGWLGAPGAAHTPARCDCVEVYQQDSGHRVFRMTFHPSLCFTQLRLTGTEINRVLLLVTDTGKVYALFVNETQLNTPRSYTVQLALKKISTSLPHLPVKQVHTSSNSALYVTDDGSAYVEVHSAGVYRLLFGTQLGFDPHDVNTPLPLSLPYKVMKCSLGLSHLCLLDEGGRVYMQGNNRYGQLGTGDKIDRGEPTQVVLAMAPVDVWCGLNHSLALLQGDSGCREAQGCGCGAGGRLPGCPKGSAVFVRLSVKVPRSARSICASKNCLYLVCCHDIDEPPVTCSPPLGAGDEGKDERERLRTRLSQMKGCDSMQEQLDMLRNAVQSHMTLSSTHKDFLDEALTAIRDGPSSSATES